MVKSPVSCFVGVFCMLGFLSTLHNSAMHTEVVNWTVSPLLTFKQTLTFKFQSILLSPSNGEFMPQSSAPFIINSFNEVVLRACSRQLNSIEPTQL